MIPARLKLDNFMCFSNIEIDFSSFKAACMVGDNGSGKSSVLDAITWALWQMARSKSDQLIKVNNQSMTVELDFYVDSVLYRVIRYYKKGELNKPRKGTKTSLELFYFDERLNTWQPSTGKNVSDTQEKLNSIIKMDYAAFINSVYIRQGNVDNFLSKSPEERKSVLIELLGLGEYEKLYRLSIKKADDLKEKALIIREQINEGEIKQFSLKKLLGEKEQLILSINSIQEQLTGLIKQKKELETKNNRYSVLKEQKQLYNNIKIKYESDIELTNKYIENLKDSIAHFKDTIAIEEVIKHQYNGYLKLKSKLKEYDIKELEYHKLKDTLIEYGSKQMVERYGAEHEYNKICENLEKKYSELENCRKIVEESEQIQRKYIEFVDLKKQVQNLDQFKIELADVELKIAKCQNVIDKFEIEYNNKIAFLESNIDEIYTKLASKDKLLSDMDDLETEIKLFNKYEAELERVREKGIAEKEVIINKQNNNLYLEKELDKLKERINLFNDLDKEPSCPTCTGKVINFNDVVRKLEFEIDNLMIQVESNDDDISIAEDEMKFLRIAYKEKKKYLSKRSNLMFKHAEFLTELKNIELEEHKLEEFKNQIIELREMLEKKDYAVDERSKIEHFNQRKQQIKDFLSNYNLMNIKLNDLSYIEEAYNVLNQSKERIKEIEAELPYFTMSKRTLEKQLNSPIDKQSRFAKDAYQKLLDLDYNLETHIEIRNELTSSQQVEYDYLSLQFAHQQLPFLEDNLLQFEKAIDTYYTELDRLSELQGDISKDINLLEDYNSNVNTISDEYTVLSQKLTDCNCDLAVINDRIQVVENDLDEIKLKRRELENVNNDISHYIELANAFGEKGIQDVMIENSIPEIQAEANAILSK
ncbi:MAG: AAA family ATPase, partial [Vampirovibrionia bacterium]